jgi:hypothetical protein
MAASLKQPFANHTFCIKLNTPSLDIHTERMNVAAETPHEVLHFRGAIELPNTTLDQSDPLTFFRTLTLGSSSRTLPKIHITL